MKTNQIMTRPMGNFHVEQRTKDGYFNATSFVQQWNLHTQNSGDVKKKEIKEYLENKSTQEFLSALIKEENLDGGNSPYVTSKARADRGGGTWMHPIMFIDFAMWLNPAFKVKVIKFVYDQMIKFRKDAGDAYHELSTAVSTLVPKDFMPVAISRVSRGVNCIVFGEHQTAIRNSMGTEELQRELFEQERKLTELINDGFITSYQQLINYMLQKYYEKYTPKVFTDKIRNK